MNVSTSTSGIKRRTVKTLNEEEENAATLHLGPEFDIKQYTHDGEAMDLIALNLSEARIVIRTALKERKKLMTPNVGANEVLKKTLDYLSVFARFRDSETCAAVEQVLKTPENSNLHPFELAQLGSLACDDTDEAKTLIPSLGNKKTDDELQNILNQLSRLETPY
ncbi:hypothetical protein WICANDRAFT_35144 [Wickerhamomyces anomalus NRRL Y-366-8]|uniref:RNA polymerase Rpb4/RPC9 core domain-containing protein n=1 Tax=Wickerhamomyces anomalus (strain ATCC 58044 / CBS 1984 / NCYC 433 / NRRL Y-366-8) TaxID=683960 RepID=A0A1E3NWP7_WICAA|nr:uncharacterized protein WICANDRAFT_35144 [Wickerhamomyces anomalus NRRL Y-366-8]ODQ57566.1 hypothetical protein WICANDRAFT_35144 [Wickerhamomyces anomalus NRRL Y-366-8]